LVWKASKTYHLSVEDIKSSSQYLKPIVIANPSYEIEAFLPMDQLALAHSAFTECNYNSIEVLADRRVEVKLGP